MGTCNYIAARRFYIHPPAANLNLGRMGTILSTVDEDECHVYHIYEDKRSALWELIVQSRPLREKGNVAKINYVTEVFAPPRNYFDSTFSFFNL